jgi:acetyl esterase/lipase
LVGLILKHKLPKPHGVFLAYPACDTRLRYSPSRLLSFDDAILYPTLLLLCLNEYLGYKTENQYDPLASPLLLSEEYVSGVKGDKRFPLSWPQTIIMIGKKDPLFDDSIRLC